MIFLCSFLKNTIYQTRSQHDNKIDEMNNQKIWNKLASGNSRKDEECKIAQNTIKCLTKIQNKYKQSPKYHYKMLSKNGQNNFVI